jgi:phosphatidylglycerol:prolipoprotein diacylglycerol transferase
MKFIWHFDPVLFSIFGLDIRWYGLAYIAGFFLALFLSPKIAQKKNLKISKIDFENLLFGIFLSGVIGGRLGFFLFYSLETFSTNFLEIFRIWHGGMSIHGGILGATIFGILWSKIHKKNALEIFDTLALPLAIALGFGRIANFINGELVGVPTDQSWGIIFPHIDNLYRHPSQLYETIKNWVLALILFVLCLKNYGNKKGFFSFVFLFGYGLMRSGIEFFREETSQILGISTGQVLSIILVFIALIIAFSQNFWRIKND